MADAARWHEQHRAGLGSEFLSAVDAAVARIEENPQIGSHSPGVDDEDVRRDFVQRFPYHAVYIEPLDRLQILAVAHDRRHRVLGRSIRELSEGVPATLLEPSSREPLRTSRNRDNGCEEAHVDWIGWAETPEGQ